MRPLRFIRYPIDTVSIFIVVSTLTLQLAALAYHWPFYLVVPILILLRQVSLVEHNHAHLKIFTARFPNTVLGWLCHLSCGVALDTYRVHHVLNHHRFNNRFDSSGRDWSSLFGFQGTRLADRPVSKIYYVLSFPFIAHGETLIWFLRTPRARLTRGFLASMTVVGITSAILAWANPLGFLIFFLGPWVIVLFGMGYNNYDHHRDCRMTNGQDSANNFLGFYYTRLSFNEGYHVAHHLKPSLHWSKLPAYHRAMINQSEEEQRETFIDNYQAQRPSLAEK